MGIGRTLVAYGVFGIAALVCTAVIVLYLVGFRRKSKPLLITGGALTLLILLSVLKGILSQSPASLFKAHIGFAPTKEIFELKGASIGTMDVTIVLLCFRCPPSVKLQLLQNGFKKAESDVTPMFHGEMPSWWKDSVPKTGEIYSRSSRSSEEFQSHSYLIFDRASDRVFFFGAYE